MSTKEQQEIKKFTGINQDLFDHMANCHDLILVQSEMEEIKEICNKSYREGIKKFLKAFNTGLGLTQAEWIVLEMELEQLLKDAE